MKVNELNPLEFIAGGGETGALIRNTDWAQTPLGDPASWPQSLRTAINLILQVPYPLCVVWGSEYTLIYNDGFRYVLGHSRHPQAMGAGSRKIFTGIWNKLLPVFDDVMQGKTVEPNVYMLPVDRQGIPENNTVLLSYKPLRDDAGGIAGILVTTINKTEVKSEDSNTYFHEMADTAPVMIWVTRQDGFCTYLNRKWYEYTGQTPRSGLGYGWLAAIHPDDAQQSGTILINAIEQQKPFSFEYRLQGNDGMYRWMIVSGAPRFSPGGTFEGFVGAVIDIDKRKAAENAARESEWRFRQLADSMPQIVWTASPDGFTDYYNQQWYEYIGNEGELGDDSFVPWLHPDDRERCVQAWYNAVATGQPYEIEYRFRVKFPAPSYRWFLARALPIRNENGQIVKWFGTCTDIDDVKHIEQSLRESEQRFRVVADNAPVMVWMTGPDKQCNFVNKGWLNFSGRTLEQNMGEGWLEVLHPEDRNNVMSRYSSYFDAHSEFEMEYRVLRNDGQYRWVLAHGIPRFSEEGIFLGYIGSCMDIHDRKEMRVELEKRVAERTSELHHKNQELIRQYNLIETILDASVDILAVFDHEMRYVACNRKCLEVYDVTREQIIGRKMEEVFPETKDSVTYQAIQRALNGEYVHNLTYKSVVVDRYYETFVVPLKNADGEIYGVLAMAHDNTVLITASEKLKHTIDEMALLNEELRRSEERYHRMTNEVEDYAILLLDTKGNLQNWNKGAEKIKGYSASEIIGRNFSIFYPKADQEAGLPAKLIARAAENGKASHEGWRIRKDGTKFWSSAVITALHDNNNEIIGFTKVTRDLTDKKLAEDKLKSYARELEQKNVELERSNSELMSFSYVASHDLQEPLRKIQAFGNLILNNTDNRFTDTGRDYFNRMIKAAVRMQGLIESLLEFSRTTTANKQFEKKDLNLLLVDVMKELRELLEDKHAMIHADGLPVLNVIPFQVKQLFSNLISNAVKYARQDVQPVISIKATIEEAPPSRNNILAEPGTLYHKITFSDNGIGFEQEYAEKIFELFQRLHGKHEYSGSGIGLAICKKIAENHNGFITTESKPDQGASFHCYFPVSED